MSVPPTPAFIDRHKLLAFLADLGIDYADLGSIDFNATTATLTYYVRGDGGIKATVDGHPLTATVTVPLH